MTLKHDPQHRDETVDRVDGQPDAVSNRLRGYLVETLSGLKRKPRTAFDLLWYYASERGRLDLAEDVIDGSTDRVKRIVREAAEITYADPGHLANTHGRVPLLEAWVDLLLVATDRVEREERWGDAYAAIGADSDNDFAEASAVEAGSRWQASQ